MGYKPTIKGKALKKSIRSPIQPMQYAQDIGSVSNLIYELRVLREDIINVTDRELEKIDEKIAEVDEKVESVLDIKQGNPGADADEQKIAEWVLSQIPIPKDGDPQQIVPEVIKEVLSKLPKMPNEASIVTKVLKLMPSPKASLKIIKEELQLDREELQEEILEEILKSPKLKLKIGNIDGLKTTLDTLDRRYMHGGGTTIAVQATAPTHPQRLDLWMDIS